jgi:Spy/CpxP family protein refolding chaperone
MRMKTQLILMALAMAFAIAPKSSFAQRNGRGDRAAWREKVNEKLNLTSEKKTKLKSIKDKMETDSLALREQSRELRAQLKAALAADESDEKLRQLNKQILENRTKAMQSRFENTLLIRSLLDEKQRKQFRSMRSEHWRKKGE